jgi:hypothetical protein
MKNELLLTLVALLAAQPACEVYVGTPDAKGPPRASAPPAPPPASAAGAPPQGPTKVVPIHLGQAGGTTSPASPPPPPSPAGCLDPGAATVASCTAVPAPDPSCSPTPTTQKCNAYRAYFNAKVAGATVSCMAGLSSKQLCDPSQVANCARGALAQACTDPSVAQLCQIAANSCKSTAAECTALLSGLNAQGQQAVAQCVAQGCSGGLFACIDGMTSNASGTSALH